MNTVWFIILALMLTAYAVLDGFDLGVGVLLPWVCRTEAERLQARHTIGPVWNGNEVWLLAAGGAMFVAFPRLYAASFSGFYLALILVLWMLILRGIGFEFRHAHSHPLWTGLWDVVFSASSLVLALLFGVAVSNVLRGVPLNAQGEFQGSFTLLLNPFALVGGLLSVAVLCLHGAAFLVMKTEGDLQARARSLVTPIWVASVVLTVAFAIASNWVRPGFTANFTHAPIWLILPLLVIVTLIAVPILTKRAQEAPLFWATSLLIISLLGSAAVGLFPSLLPSLHGDLNRGLTIYNAATAHNGLVAALIMNLVGMTAVVAYTAAIYRTWNGKVQREHIIHE
jgi:cytochrome d ubiquinol oxidase subunit II